MAKLGIFFLMVYFLIALITPLIIWFGFVPDPNEGLDNAIYAAPSFSHWCGTDRLGRDVCSRTFSGTGVALQVVFLAISFSLAIGLPIGILSGYMGGWIDRVLVLVMDTLYTLPVILLSVVMAFLLGKGVLNAAIALCIVYIPQYFRVVRNQTAQVKSSLFIDAAKSLGASPIWIARKYLFRNVLTSVPVLLTMNAADAVLVLGSLGFLGLGMPETIPEWGGDLNLALSAVPTGIWWTALYPGIAMFGLVMSLSLIGEGLQKLLDSSATN